MSKFKQMILDTKKVSIWGIGYLGYTTLLRAQDEGFSADVYDFNTDRLDEILDGTYPNKEQLNSWSKNGKVPNIDINRLMLHKEYELLFDNNIHIVSFPNTDTTPYTKLADIFIANKDKLKDALVIFQSVGVPKSIESDFCKILEDNGINIDVATIFRSDWTIEDFFAKSTQRVYASNSKSARDKTADFLSLLSLKMDTLSSIEEAEVYENSKVALSYITTAFFNQISLAYPHINTNELSKHILQDMDFSNINLGVSSVDYKSEQSIENILRGSSGDFLSILKEANSTNISFLFYYVGLLKSKNISSVTILGLSSYNSLKDTRLSPSVILAEYLNKYNIDVSIYDDSFSDDEIKEILPYCNIANIEDGVSQECVVVMNLNNTLKAITQSKIDKIGLSSSRYILDNTGYFRDFRYSKDSIYHQLGDNNLAKVID